MSERRDRLADMVQGGGPDPSSAGTRPAPATPRRALLFAPRPAAARPYLALLEAEGWDVLVATEIAAAETLLASAPPQLLLVVGDEVPAELAARCRVHAPRADVLALPSLTALLEQQILPSRRLFEFTVRALAVLVELAAGPRGVPGERVGATVRLATAAAAELDLSLRERATVRLEAALREVPVLLRHGHGGEVTEQALPGTERHLLAELASSLGCPLPVGEEPAAGGAEMPSAGQVVDAAAAFVRLEEEGREGIDLALRRHAGPQSRGAMALHPAAVEAVLAAAGRSSGGTRRGRVLLVDADVGARTLLGLRLRNEGYAVATAADGQTALEEIRRRPPALVLAETTLPRLDGFALLDRLLREGCGGMPFVFLSSRGDPLSVNKGLLLGAADYLIKPINAEVLITKLQRHLAQAPELGEASARLSLAELSAAPGGVAEMAAPAAPEYEELAPGAVVLGRFRLLAGLGEGGMGKVYRARDERLEEEVVLKVMKPRISDDAAVLRRFQREIRLARRISHPGVVRIYDFWEAGRLKFVTMEYLEGVNLKQELRRRGPFPPPVVLRLAEELLEALEAAHGMGVVHRDIKPHNLLLQPSGRVKVLDFGIAQALDQEGPDGASRGGAVPGTLEYMSPEQIAGEAVDARTDLYSAGLVLFELLTGEHAFRGESRMAAAQARITQEAPAPSSRSERVSPEVDRFVGRLLQRLREQRYGSASEALEDVRQLRRLG